MIKDFLLPFAILAGSALIAVGLYLGLRDRPFGPVLSTSASEPAPPARPPVPREALPFPGVPVPVSGVRPAVQVAVEDAAKKALLVEKQRAFVPTCWAPSVKRVTEPRTIRLVFDMTFDPQGNEIARGVSEERAAARADVGNCIRAMTTRLRIETPPGAYVRVTIPLELP